MLDLAITDTQTAAAAQTSQVAAGQRRRVSEWPAQVPVTWPGYTLSRIILMRY